MDDKKIYLSSPFMSEEGYELEFIKEAFAENWIAPLGKNVDLFEEEFQSYLKSGKAAALSSGTAAIHLGLKAVGVGKEDKPGLEKKIKSDVVICSSLTFSATANPIVYLGATPVFVDSEKKTWNMDPNTLRVALDKYKEQVKAVLVVHLYGTVALMDDILSICDEYGVPVVEDAAEALGSKYASYYYRDNPSSPRRWHSTAKETFAGTAGDIGVFSFNGNKIITTSGGGMLISNHPSRSKQIISKVHFWSTQARENCPWYQHEELGYNYRMSNILAGIGRGQLKVLEHHIEKKKGIFDLYSSELEKIGLIEMMPIPKDQRPNYWLSCGLINGPNTKTVIEKMRKNNIEARHIWKPMHMQPYYSECDFITTHDIPVCEQVFKNGICLPSDLNMTDKDKKRVIDLLKELLK